MRTTIVLGLVALLYGCASYRKPAPVKKAPAPQVQKAKRVTTPVKTPENKEKTIKLSQAVWHLIFPLEIEIILRHGESKRQEFLRVETTLSDIELPPGQYSIEGFILGDEKFEALEGQELFQFEVKKNSPTYVGSYVIECPKVGASRFSDLRKMKFFNRLNFTGDTGACELIVGNDIDIVRRAWSRLEKRPPSRLLLGF